MTNEACWHHVQRIHQTIVWTVILSTIRLHLLISIRIITFDWRTLTYRLKLNCFTLDHANSCLTLSIVYNRWIHFVLWSMCYWHTIHFLTVHTGSMRRISHLCDSLPKINSQMDRISLRFHVCMCRTCHRHDNTLNRWGAVSCARCFFYFYFLFLAFSSSPSGLFTFTAV